MWPTWPVLFGPLVCESVKDVYRMVTQKYGKEVRNRGGTERNLWRGKFSAALAYVPSSLGLGRRIGETFLLVMSGKLGSV